MCFLLVSPLLAENHNSTVKVMTRNMNAGADLAIFAALSDDFTFEDAVEITINSIYASDIPNRAAAIAAEIAETKPDLVGIQEATTWIIRTPSGDETTINQLDLLMNALMESGQHYRKALVQDLTSIDMGVLAFADHDVILVRADLPPGQLKILDRECHIYDTRLGFEVMGVAIDVLRGWMAVDVHLRGYRFKFVNTHLEAPFGDDYTKGVQVSQADQLLEDLSDANLPVILAGDFNSDAEDTHYYFPDVTESYRHILASGFKDAWDELRLWNPGYTWSLLDDIGAGVMPFERIDLIFSDEFKAKSVFRTGLEPLNDLYASDHAGVVAVFDLANPIPRHHGRIPGYGRNPAPHYWYQVPGSLVKYYSLFGFRRH
jgi:endonuclease/exonuclease/phosphatase family metal-dependent hydrolase